MTNEEELYLKELIEAYAPSGYEAPVQRVWKRRVEGVATSFTSDHSGNCVATLKGESDYSVVIAGHADEVALMVKYITDDGYLYVRKVGGVDPVVVVSQHVTILSKNGPVAGIVGRNSIHLAAKSNEAPKLHEVWIDIGVASREEAEKLVTVGDSVVFGHGYRRLQGTRAAARCFDNRIGLFIASEVLRRVAEKGTPKVTLHAVSTVQEEVGVLGAKNIAFALNPSVAIAVDVIPSTDTPGLSKTEFGDTKVSKGPVIPHGVRVNNRLSDALIDVCKAKEIPFQLEAEGGYTATDADAMSEAGAGRPITVVSVPTRYLHSTVEVLDLEDISRCVDLLTEFVLTLEPGTSFGMEI